jgi:uncharacterized protein (TIGR01777 family)
MRVIVTGASGTLGRETTELLRAAGHDVYSFVRHAARGEDEVQWDAAAGTVDQAALERVAPQACVHLAGEALDGRRWNDAQRALIRDSRTIGTGAIARALAALPQRPEVLVCASAVGGYGSRGDTVLTETSSPGDGFLAEVVRAWEAAADPARDAGIRTVHLRFGTILSREGGAMKQLLPPFKAFVGGPLGKGSNYISLVSRTDAARAILFALETEQLSGAANVSIPEPVTQKQFAKAVGKVLHRPALFPVPGFAMRMIAGKVVDETVLVSQRAVPERLGALGFRFVHPTAEEAVRSAVGD